MMTKNGFSIVFITRKTRRKKSRLFCRKVKRGSDWGLVFRWWNWRRVIGELCYGKCESIGGGKSPGFVSLPFFTVGWENYLREILARWARTTPTMQTDNCRCWEKTKRFLFFCNPFALFIIRVWG